jgi:hypothetical protein
MPRCWHQPGDEASASRRGRWQTSPVTEESAEETVKTIARGMPVNRRDRGDFACVLFHFAHKAAGAPGARHSLRPLIERAARLRQNSRGARRDRGGVSTDGAVRMLATGRGCQFCDDVRFVRHSGAVRSTEPGISRFRVWSSGPSRNDGVKHPHCPRHPVPVVSA